MHLRSIADDEIHIHHLIHLRHLTHVPLFYFLLFSSLNDTYAVTLSLFSASLLRRYTLLCAVRRDREREMYNADFFPLFPPSISSLLLISKSSTSSIILSRDHLVNRPTRPSLVYRGEKGGRVGGHTNRREGSQSAKRSFCYIEER